MKETIKKNLAKLLKTAEKLPELQRCSVDIVPDHEEEDVFYLRVNNVPDPFYATIRDRLFALIKEVVGEPGTYDVIPSVILLSEMAPPSPNLAVASTIPGVKLAPEGLPALTSFEINAEHAFPISVRIGANYDYAA